MNNLQSPAYPQQVTLHPTDSKPFTAGQMVEGTEGFTKLELASLIIAQGMVQRQYREYDPETTKGVEAISSVSIHLAKAVLEEANKETL